MQKFLLLVDKVSTKLGHAFAWSIVILTLMISYEVFSRYVLNTPHPWVFDVSYMLYGTLFMMAGAYTLSRNGHVRGDFLYRAWRPRTQATSDLILYVLFFFPGMLAFIYSGYSFAKLSYMMNEHSAASPDGPIVWPFKWLIPIVGCLMVLQGIVEVIRCIICIRTGEWPKRLHDVEETEKIMLEEAEKARLADIEQTGLSRGDI